MKTVHIQCLVMALIATPLALACESDDEGSSESEGSAGSAGSAGTNATAGTGDEAGTAAEAGTGAAGTGEAGTGAAGMGEAGTAVAGMSGESGMGSEQPPDIVDTAIAAGDFEMLAAALQSADLVDTLRGEGPFTVFAPTDAAFAAFEQENPGVLEGLSKEELAQVLTYHVVAGLAGSQDLVDAGAVATVSGAPVLFDLSDGAVVKGGEGTMANVTTADIEASNGVIHVIDAVILPPSKDLVATAVDAGFETLAELLTSQELVDALQAPGPFTVFAPTDEAFAALSEVPSGDALTSVLLYHVVEGLVGSGNLSEGDVEMLSGESVTIDLSDGVKVDQASVTSANILTKNGIIHVVDAVLVP
jgi:transforming growth factor-beta-induced protein